MGRGLQQTASSDCADGEKPLRTVGRGAPPQGGLACVATPGPPADGCRTHVCSGRRKPRPSHRSAVSASEDPGTIQDRAEVNCMEQDVLLFILLTDSPLKCKDLLI